MTYRQIQKYAHCWPTANQAINDQKLLLTNRKSKMWLQWLSTNLFVLSTQRLKLLGLLRDQLRVAFHFHQIWHPHFCQRWCIWNVAQVRQPHFTKSFSSNMAKAVVDNTIFHLSIALSWKRKLWCCSWHMSWNSAIHLVMPLLMCSYFRPTDKEYLSNTHNFLLSQWQIITIIIISEHLYSALSFRRNL